MNSPLTQRLANAPNDTLLHIINIHIKAGLFEELHELITPDLMREKRKRYGSHQSFIRDLELTIQALPGEGLNGLPHLMFYSMLYSTLRSMSTNVTPEVLRVSAAFGNMERAKAYAGTTPGPYQKALAYQILGGGGEKAQKKEKTEVCDVNSVGN